jgi:xylan 1,4-beta-xylosidase
MGLGGIRKPSYSGFALLHKMGHKRLANDAGNVLVTRREDGTLAIVAWNLLDPGQRGAPETLHFAVTGVPLHSRVRITRVDEQHANSLAKYKGMGSPRYPTRTEVKELNRSAELGTPEIRTLKNGSIDVLVPVNGLVLLEISNLKK